MTATEPEICPAAVAVRLAGLKAVQISARHPDDLVIGADQILALERSIFGKPADLAAARAQLTALRGQTHTLPTAVVLARGGKVIWKHVATAEMTMRNFDDAFLESYLAAVGMTVTETCGGYQLEGLGVQLFDRIDGDYFTVIGLPLLPLLAELRRCGAIPS